MNKPFPSSSESSHSALEDSPLTAELSMSVRHWFQALLYPLGDAATILEQGGDKERFRAQCAAVGRAMMTPPPGASAEDIGAAIAGAVVQIKKSQEQ